MAKRATSKAPLAEKDDVSIDQFIATAVAEKAAAFLTVEYLEERGRRVDPNLIDRLLARVPNAQGLTARTPRQIVAIRGERYCFEK